MARLLVLPVLVRTMFLCHLLEPPEETWQLVLHDPEGILDHLKDKNHWKVPGERNLGSTRTFVRTAHLPGRFFYFFE